VPSAASKTSATTSRSLAERSTASPISRIISMWKTFSGGRANFTRATRSSTE
jgi:hypothetical protein